MELSERDMQKLREMTVLDLAHQLEDGLIHGCYLSKDVKVIDFIKNYLRE